MAKRTVGAAEYRRRKAAIDKVESDLAKRQAWLRQLEGDDIQGQGTYGGDEIDPFADVHKRLAREEIERLEQVRREEVDAFRNLDLRADVGTIVTAQGEQTGAQFGPYTITPGAQGPSANTVGIDSPVGQQIVRKVVGDKVWLPDPKSSNGLGDELYRIRSVELT